ncbi:predicted protein [Pyrenophora tritici-repentis Pt-1C-BFP]|uniref:Uncharacterized protein n=1 Tax=Pyrenophora tritici-repentis (strain Pt-1C-BFP) TaxID=426418 RepID=B2WMJ7_PYRTR|nr:uncharacterized protein PTRG_11207 [Pyrenophora tritici-repentis Pt-1C-BFP]EDU44257.1 predicted protein [Pyrenophora tritici-repentis Pt-1C-BFP]
MSATSSSFPAIAKALLCDALSPTASFAFTNCDIGTHQLRHWHLLSSATPSATNNITQSAAKTPHWLIQRSATPLHLQKSPRRSGASPLDAVCS